jgi:hypothetical protein
MDATCAGVNTLTSAGTTSPGSVKVTGAVCDAGTGDTTAGWLPVEADSFDSGTGILPPPPAPDPPPASPSPGARAAETVIVAVDVVLSYVLVAVLVAVTTHEPAELYVSTGVEPSAKAQLVSPAFDTE